MNIDVTSIYDNMPEFNNHMEARDWFKNQFPDRFFLRTHSDSEGKMTYFYHIVKDPETYQRYMESFASEEKREITEMSTFESYTTVEISEDGDVSITL
ncbi:hypothetical protein [Bacillus timonensis]|uniref:hypothetical protein n=1 Tax=Bacillus timonensis TaxID=1033734 RepID=UPI000287F347|nr:hypothetical protein [Bacillus timonensis]